MRALIALLIMLTSFSLLAESKINLNYTSYEEAKKGSSFVVFNMESTKAGMITTSFDGVVKEATISYKKTKGSFKDIVIRIKATSLDTDNDSRNDKMYDKCLSVSKFPTIEVSIPGQVKLDNLNDAKISIRGKIHSIKVRLSFDKKSQEVSGSADLSLKSLQIPDPSIWIASVRDKIEVKFKIIAK